MKLLHLEISVLYNAITTASKMCSIPQVNCFEINAHDIDSPLVLKQNPFCQFNFHSLWIVDH